MESAEVPDAVTPGSRRDSQIILLVDDEEQVRGVAREMLEMHGYTVLEAGDGAEALEICERHMGLIDLVLTDILMPRMGGRELVERLAGAYPAMKFLYISAYADGKTAAAHGFGAPVLQKPYTSEALARQVREVLDSAPGSHHA